MPIAGEERDASFTFDWGLNGASLFGWQRVAETHNTHGFYKQATKPGSKPPVTYHRTTGRAETHSITVPDIGGFTGISYRLPNAKLSAGCRADFFFGAIDRGLDARDSATMSSHGPFATVSFELGG